MIIFMKSCTLAQKTRQSNQSKTKNAPIVGILRNSIGFARGIEERKESFQFIVFLFFSYFPINNNCSFVVLSTVLKHSDTGLTGLIGDKEFQRLFVSNRSGMVFIYSIASVKKNIENPHNLTKIHCASLLLGCSRVANDSADFATRRNSRISIGYS